MGSRYAEAQGLAIGDAIDVTFVNGSQRSYEIRALFDHPDWTTKLWVGRAAFLEAVPESLDTSVYIVAEQGVSAEELRAAVEPSPPRTATPKC